MCIRQPQLKQFNVGDIVKIKHVETLPANLSNELYMSSQKLYYPVMGAKRVMVNLKSNHVRSFYMLPFDLELRYTALQGARDCVSRVT